MDSVDALHVDGNEAHKQSGFRQLLGSVGTPGLTSPPAQPRRSAAAPGDSR